MVRQIVPMAHRLPRRAETASCQEYARAQAGIHSQKSHSRDALPKYLCCQVLHRYYAESSDIIILSPDPRREPSPNTSFSMQRHTHVVMT